MKVNLKSLALAAGLVFAPTLSFAQQAEEQPNQELKEQLLKLGRQKLKEQPALKQQTEEQETQEVEEIFRSAPASIQHISIPEQIKALSYLQRLEIGVRAYVYIVKCD
jgi:hypothetical protein